MRLGQAVRCKERASEEQREEGGPQEVGPSSVQGELGPGSPRASGQQRCRQEDQSGHSRKCRRATWANRGRTAPMDSGQPPRTQS